MKQEWRLEKVKLTAETPPPTMMYLKECSAIFDWCEKKIASNSVTCLFDCSVEMKWNWISYWPDPFIILDFGGYFGKCIQCVWKESDWRGSLTLANSVIASTTALIHFPYSFIAVTYLPIKIFFVLGEFAIQSRFLYYFNNSHSKTLINYVFIFSKCFF